MPEAKKCPTCGSLIPASAPAGQCVKCLFGYADDSEETDDRDPLPVTAEGSTALGEGQWPGQVQTDGRSLQTGFDDFEFLTDGKAGGMGVVYRVRQRSLNRIVGLKMIRAGSFATEREIERFRAEAESAARLDHPHIVPIYEIGEHQGRQYFTMKWIEGRSLAECLGEFSMNGGETEAAKLMCKIALAVQHAHERGILHRDLKPANILMDSSGMPHVTDFGLAKRLEND